MHSYYVQLKVFSKTPCTQLKFFRRKSEIYALDFQCKFCRVQPSLTDKSHIYSTDRSLASFILMVAFLYFSRPFVPCVRSSVDPLASNKGFWAEVLGVGDFYYELAVQIVEICLATRAVNGGLMSLQELLQRLRAKVKSRLTQLELSQDDVRRATSKLAVLGSGFQILEVGRTPMVVSVPRELSGDHSSVLLLAESMGRVTEVEVVNKLSWDRGRAREVLNELMQEGMAWIDVQADGDPQSVYYIPSLWHGDRFLGGEEEAGGGSIALGP
ncbi:unnamed protein product [Discosporangium mesarthrocarpum]